MSNVGSPEAAVGYHYVRYAVFAIYLAVIGFAHQELQDPDAGNLGFALFGILLGLLSLLMDRRNQEL